MSAFKSKKTLYASPELIPHIAAAIEQELVDDGYLIESQSLISGGYDISITKGGMFKAVMGMKSSLKVSIEPRNNAIEIEASVGIFGQQAVPTVIMLFFLWPVLITQIWGMVKQAQLDDRVVQIACDYAARHARNAYQPQASPHAAHVGSSSTPSSGKQFCTACGNQLPPSARFCSNCGTMI